MTEPRVIGPPLPAGTDAWLAHVARLATLEDVLAWAHARRPACVLVDVIAQDEFTHDVVLRGPERAYVVFDTT